MFTNLIDTFVNIKNNWKLYFSSLFIFMFISVLLLASFSLLAYYTLWISIYFVIFMILLYATVIWLFNTLVGNAAFYLTIWNKEKKLKDLINFAWLKVWWIALVSLYFIVLEFLIIVGVWFIYFILSYFLPLQIIIPFIVLLLFVAFVIILPYFFLSYTYCLDKNSFSVKTFLESRKIVEWKYWKLIWNIIIILLFIIFLSLVLFAPVSQISTLLNEQLVKMFQAFSLSAYSDVSTYFVALLNLTIMAFLWYQMFVKWIINMLIFTYLTVLYKKFKKEE